MNPEVKLVDEAGEPLQLPVASHQPRMTLAGLAALHAQLHSALLDFVNEPREIPLAMLKYICNVVAAGPQPFSSELIGELTTRQGNHRREVERIRRLGEAELTLDRRILIADALIRDVQQYPVIAEDAVAETPDPAAEPEFQQV